MSRKNKNYFSRSRSLLVKEFQPKDWSEQRTLDIAKATGETSVAYLKSISDRYGLHFLEAAYGELTDILRERNNIRSPAKYLNDIIQRRLLERKKQLTDKSAY